jgi:hypothetical protein
VSSLHSYEEVLLAVGEEHPLLRLYPWQSVNLYMNCKSAWCQTFQAWKLSLPPIK